MLTSIWIVCSLNSLYFDKMPKKNAFGGLGALISVVIVFCIISSDHTTTAANDTYLRHVLVETFAQVRHHVTGSEYKHKAKEFIINEMRRFGFKVEEQEFNVNENAFHNVIGIIEGVNFGRSDDHIVGIGTHYDTSRDSPGTDDNGSGVTAMLEVARQLQDTLKDNPPKNTILFVAFDNEAHDGSNGRGTKVFMNQWIKTWISGNYMEKPRPHGLYYLDGLMEYDSKPNTQNIPEELKAQQSLSETVKRIESHGSRGDFIAIVHREDDDFDLATLFHDNWAHAPEDSFRTVAFPLPFHQLKDVAQQEVAPYSSLLKNGHRTFWNDDSIPCVLLTDTAGNRGIRRTCQQCDNALRITDINIEFLTKTADVLYHTIYNLSQSGLRIPTATTLLPSTSTPSVTSDENTSTVRSTTPDVDTTTVPAHRKTTDAKNINGCNWIISDIMVLSLTIILASLIY